MLQCAFTRNDIVAGKKDLELGDAAWPQVTPTFSWRRQIKAWRMSVAPGMAAGPQTGDKEFKLTFYAVLLKDGPVNGYLQVHSTLILSESGNEFTTRDCKVEFMDANRKVLDSDNDRVKGRRLETP
jgi:hypothetical protein